MVVPGDRRRVAGALSRHGFELISTTWVRFGYGRVELVDLVSPPDWGLPEEQAEELFGASTPLAPGSSIREPAPHHRLLILARKAPRRRGGTLEDRHRTRVDRAVAEDPRAWARAAARARAWDVEDGLVRLRRAYEHPRTGASRPPRLPRPKRPRRGAVIALSGLDGSGKSTQAAALQAALERLGRDVDVVWSPMGRVRGLDALERLAGRRRPGSHAAEIRHREATAPAGARSAARRAVRAAWWCVIGAGTAWSYRCSARGTRAGGRVVIHDRYVLDGLVDLRFSSRPPASIPVAEAVFRALSPSPRWSFLLEARPETAHARKPDWSLSQTRERAELYSRLQPGLRVAVLDAEQPHERLAAQIAREVFAGLIGPR